MRLLSDEKLRNLAEFIIWDSGIDLPYFEFIEIALACFEDIPGFETSPPDLELLNDL